MSLISEALRKARQEAAEREARERGLETPVVAGYWKRGGRLGFGLILGAVIAMGAAMIGGGLVWWLLGERSEHAGDMAANVESVVVPEPTENTSDQSQGRAVPTDSVEAGVPTVAPEALPERELDSPRTSEGRPGAETETIRDSSDRQDASVGEHRVVPTPAPALPNGEFVGEAQVDGVTLTLDYLVYRKENPFAQINGNDVRVGAVIEDFVVRKITPNAVELSKGETKIVLRVQ